MSNVKTDMIPVILRATGAISKSFIKYLRNTAGKYDSNELQATAALGTVHLLWKVLT
jgi:hypothetical protein